MVPTDGVEDEAVIVLVAVVAVAIVGVAVVVGLRLGLRLRVDEWLLSVARVQYTELVREGPDC